MDDAGAASGANCMALALRHFFSPRGFLHFYYTDADFLVRARPRLLYWERRRNIIGNEEYLAAILDEFREIEACFGVEPMRLTHIEAQLNAWRGGPTV